MIEAAPCLHLRAPYSLLTLLGGRSTARLQGSITFNGSGLSKASKRKLGYVAQVGGVSFQCWMRRLGKCKNAGGTGAGRCGCNIAPFELRLHHGCMLPCYRTTCCLRS